jgi:hypothetical protein
VKSKDQKQSDGVEVEVIAFTDDTVILRAGREFINGSIVTPIKSQRHPEVPVETGSPPFKKTS